ncbi:gap junction delta-4 protein-like [Polymixia lowei]
MRAVDLLFITINHNVSFMGKTWWMLMVVLRLFVVLLAGFTLFSDEQERFVCNTIQPGCSNVCFDLFAPVSLLRLWLFHIILLCLPHLVFATHVTHEVLSNCNFGAENARTSQGSRHCYMLESFSSSRETSLHRLPRDWMMPSFHCGYFLVVILHILLEAAFIAGQFFLFGFFIPKSFLCYEAPCISGVECYISRPTEKTLMLNIMLGIAALSILLSLFDLGSSMKTMARKREMLMEEMSKGEQSSVFTTTSGAEDTDVLFTKKTVSNGNLKNDVKDEKVMASNVPNDLLPNLKTGVSIDEKGSEFKDTKVDIPHSAKPMGSPVPGHFVLPGHLKPPLSPRPERGPPPAGTRSLGQDTSTRPGSGQQSDSTMT